MSKIAGKLSKCMSLLMAAVLCVQYLHVAVEAEAAATPMRIITASTYADTGYFGDGSDGDLLIKSGQTVTLPVEIPHQSIVIKNYKSINIEVDGVLTTSAPNAGLILKVQGDVTIKGTIDQSAKAPKTNSSNAYPYPIEIQCGDGGAGADAFGSAGGKSMPARKYGGGYGGGGAGSGRNGMYSSNGGDSDKITVNTPAIFLGGSGRYWVGETEVNGTPGSFGGGGGGDDSSAVGGNYAGAAGGSGGLGGGGAGNMGGGILLLYASGAVSIPGNILCNGGAGGTGGYSLASSARGSGGGGGGGGGSIYIEYGRSNSITGNINVNGGVGGKGGKCPSASGKDGTSGTDGKFTIKKSPDSIPPIISGVTVPTAWGTSNSVTVNATDTVSGVVSYAVTTSTTAPLAGAWQSSSRFTLTTNGTYYAYAKDGVGNTTAGYSFKVEKVDTTLPVVDNVTVTPTGWTGSSTKAITVTATDGQSGIAGYGITTTTAAPSSWQTSNVFNKPTGTYYLWAKDNVGRVSGYRQAVVDSIDTVKPVISGVTVPTVWGQSSTVAINATDSGSGVNIYAVSGSSNVPMDGWQSERSFTFTQNGTYYAFCKDKAGNLCNSFRFVVDKVDTAKPTITAAEVLPSGWTGSSTKTITVTATDSQSGIADYGITTTNTAPSTWQSGSAFSKPAGTYYVWVRDKMGNVSLSKQVVVDGIDTTAPVVTSAAVTPPGWTSSGTKTITVTATDSGGSGIADYNITASNTAPTAGWQAGSTFSKAAGTYYVWARDKVGNVSVAFRIEVGLTDTVAPTVTGAEVAPIGWAESGTKTITVTAEDSQSGILGYGITTLAVQPNNWQDDNRFDKPLGTYYVWAKDNAGNVSASHRVVVENMDNVKPVIAGVTLPDKWGKINTATINATDLGNGLKDYAVSRENTLPVDGWQSQRSFTLTENGSYYAWARDKASNTSDAFSFEVEWVDTAAPTVTGAEVSPTGWTSSGTKTITVTATDSGGSGIAEYNITAINTAPTAGWQAGSTFSKAAGTYYVWARDKVGNVSVAFGIEVGRVDTVAPTVTGAEVFPTGWAESGTKTITVTAEDSQSGILGYGITTLAAPPNNWQDDNRFDKPLGTYYVWAKDNAGNVSASRRVVVENVDDVKPVIVGVTLPNEWGKTNTATINASDVGGGLKDYAVSRENTLPVDGWQSQRSFTLTENGSYYAWTRDKADNISDMFSFEVEWVDTAAPTVTGAEVSPTGWAENGTKTITVTAEDSQSGIAGYAVTTTTITPSLGGTWQKETTFTKPLGTYYVWAKDNAGNVSASHRVVVENMDDAKPVIAGVTLPDNWGQTNTATINATDLGNGLKDYAVSSDNTLPVDGWQSERSFTLTENGSYYAWARDKADNVSDAFSFEVEWVDTAAPTVTGAEVTPTGWTSSGTKTITVTAQDTQSSVTHYGVTETAVPPSSWQTGNSFSKAAGSYYVWAKDKSGRISEPMQAVVDGIDTHKPTVEGVVVTPGWGNSARVLIEASDEDSGIKDYAVSEYRYAPGTGWQPADDFTLAANGTYYAFARDGVGNLSDGFSFKLDRVDTAKPVVDRVIIAPGFSSCVAVDLEASDIGSGIKDYAVADSTTAPTDGWQSERSFTLTENGSYYAFARDMVNNISVGRFFKINKMDRLPPTISSIGYSADNGTIMIRGSDSESSVVAIYIDEVAYPGSTVSWDVPVGTRYIRLQAEDEAGNRSAEEIHRVRGWYDLLDSITIEPVEFKDDNRRAIVIGKTTGENEISGVYVNGKFQDGNPVAYMVSAGTEYLELQAQDIAGDRSKLYRVRVPGWSQETAALSIVDVRFAQDNSTAQVTAMSTGGVEVRGIRVNGEMQVGNPITYEIPTGTTHLKMQAEDMNGDRSAILIRRVPGWSEVVTTLTVTDVTFTDYNTTAQITATATGGDSVSGIIVNEKVYEGNPIVYTVPKDTETLHIQAYNPQGDKSPMVNKAVPMDSSKSTLKLSIEHPEWTKGRSARVKLVAEDKNRVTKILVRTGEDSEWADVTEKRYIDITADTTVYATVENDKGESKEVSQDIDCFDRTAPTVTATQDGKTINIRATDNKSGVTSILVNNKEYRSGDFEDGKLAYRIPEGTTMVIIKAEDAAGNLSRAVELPIESTVAALPVIIAPTPAPTPKAELLPEEAAIPEPKPTPTPRPEPETPEPEPPMVEAAAQPEPLPPAARAAVAAGGVGSTAMGGIWYWLRKVRLSKPVEELELMGKKLLYDESEFGGAIDPLDKTSGKEEI